MPYVILDFAGSGEVFSQTRLVPDVESRRSDVWLSQPLSRLRVVRIVATL
jgi:hypothetical protein